MNDTMGTAEFGEDCLVLNIYCNTTCTDSKKPVMVYMFGVGGSALIGKTLGEANRERAMFALSEALAHPFSAMFLNGAAKLLPDTIRAFRIVSVAYLFTGMAVFGSAFFTALNNGQVSGLISFLRTFVFELGAVLLLPPLLGVDGIWLSVVFGELMAAAAASVFIAALQRKYHY